MIAICVNHKWDSCPTKGSTQAPVHPHTKLSKYRTRIIWTWWKLAWRYSHVSSGALFQVCPGLSFATKRIGPPCCTLFTFIDCYPLPITLSQNYLLPINSVIAENTLQKTTCISLCFSLGSTLLLIERTTIDPLYLWVIKTLFWHHCRGVKRLW